MEFYDLIFQAWRVLESWKFYDFIFQALKVMEFRCGSWKVMENDVDCTKQII